MSGRARPTCTAPPARETPQVMTMSQTARPVRRVPVDLSRFDLTTITSAPDTPETLALADRLAAEHVADQADSLAEAAAAALLALQDAAAVEAAAHRTLVQIARAARAAGASWASIGATLGVTRQAAQQRFSVVDGA